MLRRIWKIAKVLFAQKAARRSEVLVLVLASLVPLLMMLIWLEIAKETSLTGFTAGRLIAYFGLMFFIGEFISSVVAEQLDHDIRSGEISSILMRPTTTIAYYYFADLIGAFVRIIPISLVVVPLLLATEGGGSIELVRVPIAAFSILLGFTISFSLYFLAGSTAFWSEQATTFDLVLSYSLTLFGGLLAPLNLYPTWMQDILFWTPFPYIAYFPVQVAIGGAEGQSLSSGLLSQLSWALLLLVTSSIVWSIGVKRAGEVG